MNVLVINCGSSSLKYQLINSESEEVLAKGLCERIGINGSAITHQPEGKEKVTTEVEMQNHTQAVQYVIEKLTDKEVGVIASLDEIDAVGHRVVHGGEKFASSVVITDEIIKAIEECNDLAPLHNPANLIGIRACQELMPNVPMVAVFDTAFHQTMPEKAYMYGIPYEYYEKYAIRRYGAHGTSHRFVSGRLAEILGTNELRVITCHLGNGCSISAIKNGVCVDTSMGLTPLDGFMMGTRSGGLDPTVVTYIMEKDGGDYSKLQLIPNAVTNEAEALKNKDTDAIWIYYAWAGVAAEMAELDFDYFALTDIDEIFDYYTPVIVASNAFLKEKPEVAKAFMRATKKGYDFAVKNPEEAAEILVDGDETGSLDGSLDFVAASQQWVSEKYIDDANEWGVSLTDDGVHFTEAGHKAFAEGLTKVLKLWYSIGQRGRAECGTR